MDKELLSRLKIEFPEQSEENLQDALDIAENLMYSPDSEFDRLTAFMEGLFYSETSLKNTF